MINSDAPFWVSACLAVAVVVVWAMRIWLKSAIEQGIRQTFERDLEAFKSDLRARESRLNTLQNALLSGRAGRNALIEKRQIEAVEAVWAEVVRLRPATIAAMSVKMLKFDVIDRRIDQEPNLATMLESLKGKMSLEDISASNVAICEPFVSAVLWSRFSAYRSVLVYAVSKLELTANNIKGVDTLLDGKSIIAIVQAVIPGSVNHLERVGSAGVYHYIEQLADLTLQSVRDELAGVEADAHAVAQAKRVAELAHQNERATLAAATKNITEGMAIKPSPATG